MVTINITGEIWDSENIVRQLKEAQEDVRLVINSPGGVVDEGLQIINAINNIEHTVTAEVQVLAGSIAAIIALSCTGEKLYIDENALFMMHNCWVQTAGNKKQLQEDISCMEAIDKIIHGIIAKKCKEEYVEQILAAVDNGDVWLCAEQVAFFFSTAEITNRENKPSYQNCLRNAVNLFEFKLEDIQDKAEEKQEEKQEVTITEKLKELLNYGNTEND